MAHEFLVAVAENTDGELPGALDGLKYRPVSCEREADGRRVKRRLLNPTYEHAAIAITFACRDYEHTAGNTTQCFAKCVAKGILRGSAAHGEKL